jgi:hypothetical protein
VDAKIARVLLASLIERLDADSRSENPKLSGLLSSLELSAMKFLTAMLPEMTDAPNDPALPVAIEARAEVEEVQTQPPEKSAGHLEPPTQTSAPQRDPKENVTAEVSFAVNERAFSFTAAESPLMTLCIDFGTAKSKAFAASEGDEQELFELGLGKRDGDLDGSIYAVSSSVWIEDDGRVFAGAQAVQRGRDYIAMGNQSRRRLDSIKQELSQIAVQHDLSARLLDGSVNPSDTSLSYEDIVTFYLAYVTDLAVSELEAKGVSRYLKRRFTMPCWATDQRRWAGKTLSDRFTRAQVLADTFHDRWSNGIPAAELKHVLAAIKTRRMDLLYLLDRDAAASEEFGAHWGGLLEPLAAGSGRLWSERSRNTFGLVLVADIGAGTTDFSLFWVNKTKGTAFPVYPAGYAIRTAGDTIDSRLVAELLKRAHVGADHAEQRRVTEKLFRDGVRRLKEQLFLTGSITCRLVTDQTVTLTLDEFLATDSIKAFTQTIETELQQFLSLVDPSWSRVDRASLVLTGGGAGLPMVKDLGTKIWKIGGNSIVFRKTPDLPAMVEEKYDDNFKREYLQLAVAIGGALPVLDERRTYKVWMGDAPEPGSLERFSITGT